MSLRHLTLLVLLNICISGSALAIDSSSGPRSAFEAQVLYREGSAAFGAKDYQQATNFLQRFVDRYPGNPGYLESHLLLGRSLLELGRSKDALAPLQYFIQGSKDFEKTARTRLILCETYLKLHDAHEAYLSALEIERLAGVTHLSREVTAEGLLYKIQALLDLKQEKRASITFSAAKKLTVELPQLAETQAHVAWLDQQLKLVPCNQLPSRGPLEEDQVRAQMDRKGICLNEATLIYRALLETGSNYWPERATKALAQSYENYAKFCAHPPLPPRNTKKKRTKEQLAQYQAELADRIVQDCELREKPAYDVLTQLKQTLPKNLSALSDTVLKTMRVKSP